ncbi:MAG: MBL fold metallo-hydrolase [Thermomicrobiales bacterium]|nr:MBL fold metallo-hydrolase [Thermomicrobiales bacterium]MCO5221658.1 MBL fold metallo-hydrolase [Thermomicrobiales bacterium]
MADSVASTRLVSLASGSSGNAILVQHGSAAGLIDCGIGPNILRTELLAYGLRLADLSFVYVTHEHIDHVRAVPALRKAGVPVVTGSGTAQAMGLERSEWLRIQHGRRFECGGIEVTAIRTSHDAADPMGAVVTMGGRTAAIFTDMGEWDEVIVDAMLPADVIVVEANHNVDMLRRGPYPAHLKRRVLSRVGHLSNDDCGRLTDTVREHSGKDPVIFLAHLSETNNSPAHAVADVAAFGGWEHDGLTPLPRRGALDLLARPPAARRPATEVQQPLFAMEPSPDPGL